MNDLTMEKVAEAVAKQQPKKVTVKTTYYDELIAYDTYEAVITEKCSCPACDVNLFGKPNYCGACGQRLDFGGV